MSLKNPENPTQTASRRVSGRNRAHLSVQFPDIFWEIPFLEQISCLWTEIFHLQSAFPIKTTE